MSNPTASAPALTDDAKLSRERPIFIPSGTRGEFAMNGSTRPSTPNWPRIVGALGLIWNLYGVYQYFVDVGILAARAGPSMASAMPPWVTAAFATAVFAGVLGSLCLLVLNRWATALLVVSLLADLAWDVRMASGGDHGSAMGLVAAVTLIGVVLVSTAHWAGKNGLLR
jgi:hypothetical protein